MTLESLKEHLKPRLNGPNNLTQTLIVLLLGAIVGATGWALRDRLTVEHRATNLETRVKRNEKDIAGLQAGQVNVPAGADIVTRREYDSSREILSENIRDLRQEMREGFAQLREEIRKTRK